MQSYLHFTLTGCSTKGENRGGGRGDVPPKKQNGKKEMNKRQFLKNFMIFLLLQYLYDIHAQKLFKK